MQTYLLIAQNCDAYQPIGEVTESEADEFAKADKASRSAEAEDFCPEEYALWKRGSDGRFSIHRIINIP